MKAQRELQPIICKKFNETAMQYPQLASKLAEFIKIKTANPMQQYGPSDKPFNPDGPLGKLKIVHAHLSHDVSILYRIKGSPPNLYLFGLFSHKESGTDKSNQNRNIQKSLAKSLSNQFPDLTEDDNSVT